MLYVNKPSKRSLTPMSKVSEMIQEQNQRIYDNEQSSIELKSHNDKLFNENYTSNMIGRDIDRMRMNESRSKSAARIKKALLVECMYKLFLDSNPKNINESDKLIGRNMIISFVNENGVINLLNRFKTKNYILSEMNRITNKYYNLIVEGCKTGECIDMTLSPEFTIPDTYRRDFFEELEDLDTEDCSKLIKDRVADSITNFIDANISNRLDYEEVLQTATDQIDRVNVNTNESAVKEKAISSINSRTKMRLNEMRQSKSKNIYQAIVEQITKASIKDDDMKARFVNESGVNMDRVTNAAQMIYTVLEMVNTTQMVDINETYLDNYLNSLR